MDKPELLSHPRYAVRSSSPHAVADSEIPRPFYSLARYGSKKWKSITSNPEADHQTPRDDFLTIIASLFYIVEEYSLA